jgi:hypothetical protein
MEKVGLVWNVIRITPERQAQKLIVPGTPAVAAATATAAASPASEPERDRVPTPTG